MKLWLVRICVLLVLGAIVNVAVAWGAAYWASFRVAASQPDHVAKSLSWFADVRPIATRVWFLPDDSAEALRSTDVSDLPKWVDWPDRYPTTEDDEHYWGWQQFQDGLGWPFVSLTCTWTTQSDYLAMTTDGLALSDHPDGPGGERERALPLHPVWPGFAINTVFYAGVLWLLFAFGGTPLALRRRRRIKRGLCPKCAYDLRGSKDATACPECGAAVNRIGR